MQMMPVFEIIESANFYSRIPTISSFKPTKRMLFRTSLVLVTAFGAMVVPKFGLFVNLIGAFACTALAFILPVRIYDQTHKEEITRRRQLCHYALMAFGIFCGLISFVISVKDLAAAFSAKDESAEEIAPNENDDSTTAVVDLNNPNAQTQAPSVLPPGDGLKLLLL